MAIDKSKWPKGVDMPSKEQRLANAKRLAASEDATKAELQAAADAVGVRATRKGRTKARKGRTKADLREAISEAASENTPDQES